MTEGAASLMAGIYGLHAAGLWSSERASNFLDGGAYYYGTFACADGKFIAIGSIEGKFHDELVRITGLAGAPTEERNDRAAWPDKKARLAEIIKTKTRDEWDDLMSGSDVCYAPVLDLDEAPRHPHNVARQSFIEVDGVLQPGTAPRFSQTPGGVSGPPPAPGQHSDQILADWGFADDEIVRLRDAGAVH